MNCSSSYPVYKSEGVAQMLKIIHYLTDQIMILCREIEVWKYGT